MDKYANLVSNVYKDKLNYQQRFFAPFFWYFFSLRL